MKNNKTLLPPLYYHTPPLLSSPIFRVGATLKTISKFSENCGGNRLGVQNFGHRDGGIPCKPFFYLHYTVTKSTVCETSNKKQVQKQGSKNNKKVWQHYTMFNILFYNLIVL